MGACCAEKLVTAVCVILPLRSVIDQVIYQVEAPLRSRPKLELVLVMVVVPALLNCLFVWVVDNLIKGRVDDAEDDDAENAYEKDLTDESTYAESDGELTPGTPE